MFNFIKTTISTLTNIIKTPKVLPVIEEVIVAPQVIAKTPRVKKVNEIDSIFLELSKEMNIPFVKGKFAPKEPKTETTPRKFVKIAQPALVETTGLIQMGKKGVSNTQMIPAIKTHIDNIDNLRTLYTAYPEVFKSTIKYMPTKMQSTLLSIIN